MTLADDDAVLRTERLSLRRITPDDLPFYARIHGNPDVARYIAHGKPRSPDETRTWLDQVLQSYETTGLGQLAVIRGSDQAIIGRCGLSHLQIATIPEPDGARMGYYFPSAAPDSVSATEEAELGYTFDPAVWGNGYAREAAGAVFEYSTTTLNRRGIISLIHAGNLASLRLAQHFGVEHVDRVVLWGRRFNRYRWPDQA